MEIQVLPNDVAAAEAAARVIASESRAAVKSRNRFVMAVSGGKTPWLMLRALAKEEVPWPSIHIFQVDERVAPPNDPDRNLTHLRDSLLNHAPLPAEHIHAMPVEAPDLEAAADQYERLLRELCGSPPVLDLVHLGLGPDGHTASLVPGDRVLEVTDKEVAPTGIYMGRRRLTLTYPALNRSRRILWLVTGTSKAAMLARLVAADPAIPAGRVSQNQSHAIVDQAAQSGKDNFHVVPN